MVLERENFRLKEMKSSEAIENEKVKFTKTLDSFMF